MYSDGELDQMICDADERAHSGRVERLRFLVSNEDAEPAPVDVLAFQYYEEARLCWYVGAFVATIVMVQLSFEELLRSHYRAFKGVNGDLNEHVKVDNAGFKALIEQAKADVWLYPDEADALDRIRKDLRNPYVHVHDFDAENDFNKPNPLRQLIKITAPELVGSGVEDEAREAIGILVSLFRRISRRFWGLGDH